MRLFAAWFGFCTVIAAQQPPQIATVQLPPTTQITGALATDVDGDGRIDLVLATWHRSESRRELQLHLAQTDAPRFRSEPSAPPVALDRDVVAFTYADCDGQPGRDLVLFTPEQAVRFTRSAEGEPQYEPLFRIPLVWPAATGGAVLPLADAVVDLDGDGRDDLLVPTPDGIAVFFSCREPADGSPFLLAPWQNPLSAQAKTGNASMRGDQLRLQLGETMADDGDDREQGPLLSLRTRAPICRVLDLDGNGRADLVLFRNLQLWSWRQRETRSFAARQGQALPLAPDRLTLFDPSFDLRLAQISGGTRPDLMLTQTVHRGDEVEVRIDLHLAAGDEGWAEKPTSRLRVQALAMPPQLVDADGDGKLDVALLTVRTDLLRNLTGEAPKQLEAQLNIFRNTGDRFATPAAMTQTLQLPLRSGRNAEPFLHVLPGGNGNPGSVLLRQEQTLGQRALQRSGERLTLGTFADAVALANDSRVLVLPGLPPGEIVVMNAHELLHVRMP